MSKSKRICSTEVFRRRTEMGLTQEKLAELCGLGVKTIRYAENDSEKRFNFNTIQQLAKVLKCEYLDLVSDDETFVVTLTAKNDGILPDSEAVQQLADLVNELKVRFDSIVDFEIRRSWIGNSVSVELVVSARSLVNLKQEIASGYFADLGETVLSVDFENSDTPVVSRPSDASFAPRPRSIALNVTSDQAEREQTIEFRADECEWQTGGPDLIANDQIGSVVLRWSSEKIQLSVGGFLDVGFNGHLEVTWQSPGGNKGQFSQANKFLPVVEIPLDDHAEFEAGDKLAVRHVNQKDDKILWDITFSCEISE